MVLYWFLVSPVCTDWYWCPHDTQKCTGGGREGRTEEKARRGDVEGREREEEEEWSIPDQWHTVGSK